MKFLSTFTIAFLLFSCHPSTESKLADAIKQQYREGFKLRGEQEDMISVDNITYGLGDSSIYFVYRYGLETDNFIRLTDLYKQDLDAKLWDLLKKLDSDRDKSMARSAFLQKRMESAAKGNYIYKVKYHIKYKTSAEGVDQTDSMYLHYPDLNFVYVNVDSLSGL